MALRWIDGFDYYDTNAVALVYEEWSNNARLTILAGGGRNGTQGLRSQATSGGSSGNGYVRKTISGTETTIIVGFGLLVVNNDTGTIELCSLDENAAGVDHISLRLTTGTSTYGLSVGRGNYTELGSAAAVIPDGTYVYVEMKAVIHDTTGSVEVRVNGVTVINVTGVDTRNGGVPAVTQVLIGNGRGNANNYDIRQDDVYVCDGTGSLNNGFLGDSRVAALYPTGAGTTTQWTPSAGSNWQNVDEAPPDEDTTYNSETTAGEIDLYAMANLPSTAGSVAGIKEVAYHRKDDAGARTLRHVLRTGATNYEGADIAVADGYTYAGTVLRELNPNTGVAWTGTDIDGLEAGVKLQA